MISYHKHIYCGVVEEMNFSLGNIFAVFNKKAQDNDILESIIGERCKVIELVDNYAGCGLVKVKGQIWAARSVNEDDVFEVGERIWIVAIEGAKLVCKR